MSKDSVSIVLPCFWADESLLLMTEKCLESILVDEHLEVELIVVDDGSPLKAELGDAIQITLPENQGYAAAVNAGLDAANGEYLVISNNDIIFIQPDWLEQLLRPLKEGAGISTIRTTEPDGWQTENKYEENAKFGSLWAMTRATYEALGGLDERFGKGYGEDLDYWHRARNAGIRIVKNHSGLAEHLGKATFKVTDPKDTYFNEFLFAYHRKWPKEHRIFLIDENMVIGFNKWEIEDMDDRMREQYLKREISIEELERRWHANQFPS